MESIFLRYHALYLYHWDGIPMVKVERYLKGYRGHPQHTTKLMADSYIEAACLYGIIVLIVNISVTCLLQLGHSYMASQSIGYYAILRIAVLLEDSTLLTCPCKPSTPT